jgi:retron-type reverse transcriptase
MNILLKLWTALIKDACSKYAETHGILSDQKDGFRHQRSIHDALSSIIMMMEDAKNYNKDIYVMHVDFKGAFNAANHRIMFKHMRQLGTLSTFVDICEQLYGVSSTDYITPYGHTPSIDINRGTLQGDTLSPLLFTLFLEPFLRWRRVGSRGFS